MLLCWIDDPPDRVPPAVAALEAASARRALRHAVELTTAFTRDETRCSVDLLQARCNLLQASCDLRPDGAWLAEGRPDLSSLGPQARAALRALGDAATACAETLRDALPDDDAFAWKVFRENRGHWTIDLRGGFPEQMILCGPDLAVLLARLPEFLTPVLPDPACRLVHVELDLLADDGLGPRHIRGGFPCPDTDRLPEVPGDWLARPAAVWPQRSNRPRSARVTRITGPLPCPSPTDRPEGKPT